jgi:hypothetical protein
LKVTSVIVVCPPAMKFHVTREAAPGFDAGTTAKPENPLVPDSPLNETPNESLLGL